MSGDGPAALSVVRGSPTPEELGALLSVLAAFRRTAPVGPAPRSRSGWAGHGPWRRPTPAKRRPDAAGWQRSPALTEGRRVS